MPFIGVEAPGRLRDGNRPGHSYATRDSAGREWYDVAMASRGALTDKQRLFAEAYASAGSPTFGNATLSAEKAGYGGSRATLAQTGFRLSKIPKIQEYCKALQRKEDRHTAVTVESVLGGMERIRRRAEDEGKYAAALKALELQGRHLAMFTDRLEHVRSIEEVPMEELLKAAGELAARVDPDLRDQLSGLLGRSRPVPKTEKKGA